ncbi:MAG: MqsA [Circoviridae sp.]|nr:MAG: MqsA [Circoviridae sp.]
MASGPGLLPSFMLITQRRLSYTIERRKNNGRLVDHVRTLWQRKFDCNVSYRTRLLFLVLHERTRTGGHSMKCQKCGHEMNFREDAWPQEIKPGSWVELWICPKCGEEIVN